MRYLPLLFFPALLCGQQLTFATYQGGSGTESSSGVVQDSNGNIYVAGTTDSTKFPVASAAGGGFIVKLDSSGKRLAAMILPGASISINAIAVDASNNIVIAGTGASSPQGSGFVSKLNSALTQALWTSNFQATPYALAIDASGNIYTAGSAATGFVTTAGVLQTANKGGLDAFVMKLSGDGAKVQYATYLGGSNHDAAYAIAVDSAGQAFVTGGTVSTDFPVSTGAPQIKFGGVDNQNFLSWNGSGDTFVTKIDSKGATLMYSTYLGGAADDQGNAIVVDALGNAYIAGATESALAGLPAGAYQPIYAGPTPDGVAAGDAFVAKFSPSGALAWYTYLGGSTHDAAAAIALDNAGNIYVAGNTDSADFPQAGNRVPDCHIGGRPFLAKLDPNGAKLLSTTGMSGIGFDQVYAMSFDAVHSVVYLAGDVASEVFFASPGAAQTVYGGGDADAFAARIDLTLQPSIVVSCVLNSASYMAGNTAPFPTGAVAPGEIVSLFGLGIGPATPANLQLTSAGTVSTTLGGTQVFFDGLPAPLIYAASGQINAVVPYGIHGPVTQMTVVTGTQTGGPVAIPVVAAVPAIYSYSGVGSGQAAALNPDYSYNTVDNPVKRGSYITLYACGAGLLSTSSDGAVIAEPFPTTKLPVTVSIRGVDAQVLYAGAAPGYISGVLQVNVAIPTDIDFGSHVPVTLNVGTYSSQLSITIAVQ